MDKETEIIPLHIFQDYTGIDWSERDSYLCCPQNIFTYNYTLEQIGDSLYYWLTNSDKSKILINSCSEGLAPGWLEFCDFLTKYFKNKFNISKDIFVFVIGCLHDSVTKDHYIQICEDLDYEPLKLLTINTYEQMAASDVNHSLDQLEHFNLDFRIKSHTFLCFNGVARPHRIYLAGECLYRNIFDKGAWSFHNRSTMDVEAIANLKNLYDYGLISENQFYKLFYQLTYEKNRFPITRTLDFGESRHPVNSEDLQLYNDSYFSVVTESSFFDLPYKFPGSVSHFSYFYTEKTFKPIKCRHPFILVSRPYSLKYLRDIGYETFHPFINESYDTIENDEERMISILDEIERLTKFSDNDWKEFHDHVKHITDFNFKHLLKQNIDVRFL